ncbi:hypothetical protein AMECASPLE_027658 [Ameca splendens]|uniref:Uncharacterized protein n=1 Tax=Ameca splendens TaxID=208324 RepID=A0ABV0Z363_9TELE
MSLPNNFTDCLQTNLHLCDGGGSGRGLSCNRWVAGSNPHSVSVVVSLDKTLHPLCLLMVVRGLGGASVWQSHLCQAAQGNCGYNVVYHCQCVNVCMNGWMTDCSVKRFGVSGDLIKCYTSTGHLPFTLCCTSVYVFKHIFVIF